MTTNEILTIAALLLGPLIAVQLTRRLDDKKEVRERKLSIFKTLMGTRAYTTSLDHVGALNRIDLDVKGGAKVYHRGGVKVYH